MVVFIFTKNETAFKKIFSKNAEFIKGITAKHKPGSEDISYIDVSGLSEANAKIALTQLKKTCKNSSWGVIDPKGSVKDIAALFFDGASDYLGPAFFKAPKPMDAKRIKTVLQWRVLLAGTDKTVKAGIAAGSNAKEGKAATGLPKTGIKLPSTSLFPGWKNMQTGKTMPFYLLYCSLQGKIALNSRFGEHAYSLLHKRFLSYLFQNFQDGEGHIWMDSGKDCLFLLPPKAKNAEAVIASCFRLLASAPLIAIEVFGLTIPVNFVFALHYGSLSYSPPGQTGTIVSDAVNYVFHLGPKKAEPGRLTISGNIPDGSIPQPLEDCFVSAGEFEDIKIWHTKKFSYVKPWL